MGTEVRWRLPTFKEIGVTILIVLPLALLLAIPLHIVKAKRNSGAVIIKQQLLGSEEEIRSATSAILENPKILPVVIKELESSIYSCEPKTRLTILTTLKTVIPDEEAFNNSGVIIQLSMLINDLALNDSDEKVRSMAEECMTIWNL